MNTLYLQTLIRQGAKLGLALLALSLPHRNLDAQSLAWKFAEGDRFSVDVEQRSNLVSEVDSVVQKIDSEYRLEIDWEVVKVDHRKIATVKQTIKRWRLLIRIPTPTGGRTVEVDTASDDAPAEDSAKALENLKKFIDEPFEITILPSGEITEVEIPEALKKKIREAPQSMQVRQLLGEEQIKQMYGSAVMVFPEEGSNETWTQDREFTSPLGKMAQRHTFKKSGEVAGDDGSLTKIDIEANLEVVEPVEKSDTKVTGQMGTGVALFDAEAGYLRSLEFNHQLKTTKEYRELKINSDMKSELKMEIRRTR